MSVETDERNITDYYMSAFDIAGILRSNCDDFIEYVVQQAENFFVKENYSPIVEQNKRKSYMIDYFFLVKCLADYGKVYIEKNYDADENVSEILRSRIRNDFGQGKELIKHGKFFIMVLNFFGYIIPSSHPKFMYMQICYERKDTDLVFVQNAILLNGKGIERFKDRLSKFCENSMYTELAKGPSSVAKVTREKSRERKFIEDFIF